MKLPKLSEYINKLKDTELSLSKIYDYTNFLTQPLELWMFVPCDDDGDILEKPDFLSGDYDDNGYGDVDKYQYKEDLKEYQKALDRVIFKNCNYNSKFGLFILSNPSWFEDDVFVIDYSDQHYECSTIEDIIDIVEITDKKAKELNL